MRKANNVDLEKLVDNIPLVSLDMTVPQIPLTKKRSRIRRIAEPHIRGHQVKGKTYYYFCHGTNREIYLGDAESILKAIKGDIRRKVKSRKKRHAKLLIEE